jgi:hypothetical protein
MQRFLYTVAGIAADGQTWNCADAVEVETDKQFVETVNKVLRDCFVKLTKGEAVFGRPGLGCSGPYRVTAMNIKLETP